MEHQGPVSNEAEFEYWLTSAFESERKRLREHAAARNLQPKANVAPDRKVTSITGAKKRDA